MSSEYTRNIDIKYYSFPLDKITSEQLEVIEEALRKRKISVLYLKRNKFIRVNNSDEIVVADYLKNLFQDVTGLEPIEVH